MTFPMNESATISSVKSLSLSDDEVQHHLRAIRRHQKAIHGHVKALLGADDLDDDVLLLMSWRRTTLRRRTLRVRRCWWSCRS